MKIERGHFAIVDGSLPVPLTDDRRAPDKPPETIEPDIDENGIPVYRDAPIDMVRHYIHQLQGSRYKLYQTPAQRVHVRQPTGRLDLVTFNPWYYEKCVKAVPAKGGGSEYKEVIEWHENDCSVHTYDFGPVIVGKGIKAEPETTKGQEPAASSSASHTASPTPRAEPARTAKTPQQYVEVRKKEAAERIGADAVREVEQKFRSDIGKSSGLFSKNQCYDFIEVLNQAVAESEDSVDSER